MATSEGEDQPKDDIKNENETITDTSEEMTYAEKAKANGMRFTVTDVPPVGASILLGFQHYLTMLGATVLIPLLIAPDMEATAEQTAELVGTITFGINTLVQTTLGDRLPIVQGGSFAYLSATFSIIFNQRLQAIEDSNERFETTMRTIQGAIIVSGIVQLVLGYSGLIVPLLRFISPVTIVPVIAMVGLSLFNVGFNNLSTCFEVGLLQMATIVLFSQYMKRVEIVGYPVFALFPIILAIFVPWSYTCILTAADVWEEGDVCRSNLDLLEEVGWIRIPYPGQWGAPIFEAYAILRMLNGALAGMIESIGDYYSCSNLAGAPKATPGIISRGLAGEGIGVIVAGLFGTGNGTTSYSENIGALQLTRVGSRAVVQCGAVAMILVGAVIKIGALFASMPTAMTGGIYCCVFGLIISVGLSNMQYVDMNSQRNLFMIASQETNPFGTTTAAEIALAFFGSPIIIAMLSSFILDNTIPGTREERGLQIWDKIVDADVHNDPE